MLSVLLDLVLPTVCAGCRAGGGSICPTCQAALTAAPLGRVAPTPCPAGLPQVVARARYDGALKALLVAHKERAQLRLTAPLGRSLAGVVELLDPGPAVLCPVPSSRAAVRARGYDHAARLARTTARSLCAQGIPVVARQLLEPARRTLDQAGLSTAERARNLHGALCARQGPAVRVVLLDDVMTTGATLVEAARALRLGGHQVVGAAVLGATARRASPGSGQASSPGRR